MDIHKPKPWHGLREFLKEYLIIVIGVLTALGAEAVVERLHEGQLSREARAAIRTELNLDLASALGRQRSERCVTDRMAEIENALHKADRGQPFPLFSYFGLPSEPTVYSERWQAATAAGRTSLLPMDEQRDYARVYHQLAYLDANELLEQQAWARIGAIQDVAHPSAETLARLREALGEARRADFAVRGNIRAARGFAARIGIKGDTTPVGDPRRVVTICLPTTTNPADVASLSHNPVWGDDPFTPKPPGSAGPAPPP